MAPLEPDKVAARLSAHIKSKVGLDCDVMIMDANDIAATVLGKCRKDLPNEFGELIFADNPLDQCDQQTPIAIIRKQ